MRDYQQHPLVYTGQVDIRWTDVDAYNIVHHSRFFIYFEEARFQWLQACDFVDDGQLQFPVVSAQIQYKHALSYPSTLYLDIYAPPKKLSQTLYQTIRTAENPDKIYTMAKIKLACINTQIQKLVSFPDFTIL